jgi:hypothetical protein
MSLVKPHILAAITGAIQSYLADEEAALLQQQASGLGLPGAASPSGPAVNLWALAGRQEAMQMRFLMQRRSFR